MGNIIYEENSLKRIMTDNGYIEGGIYYFYVKDHLGNNRIVANQSAGVIQSNQYYPFGMLFAESTNQDKQDFKYNGKELDQMHGLNQYDYSARYYDPVISRFTTMDPLAEKKPWLSPYLYGRNNPMRFIDPDGRDEWEINNNGEIINRIVTDKHDSFHMVDNKGVRIDGQSLSFDYGTIISQTTDKASYFDGKWEFSYDIYNIKEQGSVLFKFLADNTSVEWSLSTFKDENGLSNYLTTSHNITADEGFIGLLDKSFISNQILKEHTHSHPYSVAFPSGTLDYPYGRSHDGAGDVGMAKRFTEEAISKGFSIPIFNLYVPGLKKTVPYNMNSKFSDFQ